MTKRNTLLISLWTALQLLSACSAESSADLPKRGSNNAVVLEKKDADVAPSNANAGEEDERVTAPTVITGSPQNKTRTFPNQLVPNGRYSIKGLESRKCIDLPLSSLQNETTVQIFQCNMTSAQKFEIQALEENVYRITNVNSGKSLEVRDRVVEEGALIQQNDYFALQHQQFVFDEVTSGVYQIKIKGSNLFMDVVAHDINDYAKLSITSKTALSSQQWILIPTY
jgi:hypothetical protein